MKQQQSITSLPQSPDEERRGRVIRYSIAMGVRVLCVILAFFLPGWWQLAAVLGAIVLPYFAVILANVAVKDSGATVLRPGAILPVTMRDPQE
jgi:predicted tellurium resistance membrane protein TerC